MSSSNPLANLFKKNQRTKNVVDLNSKLSKIEKPNLTRVKCSTETKIDREPVEVTKVEQVMNKTEYDNMNDQISNNPSLIMANENGSLSTDENFKKMNDGDFFSTKPYEALISFLQEYETDYYLHKFDLKDINSRNKLNRVKNDHHFLKLFCNRTTRLNGIEIEKRTGCFKENDETYYEPSISHYNFGNSCSEFINENANTNKKYDSKKNDDLIYEKKVQLHPVDISKLCSNNWNFEDFPLTCANPHMIEDKNYLSNGIDEIFSLVDSSEYIHDPDTKRGIDDFLRDEINLLFLMTDPNNQNKAIKKKLERKKESDYFTDISSYLSSLSYFYNHLEKNNDFSFVKKRLFNYKKIGVMKSDKKSEIRYSPLKIVKKLKKITKISEIKIFKKLLLRNNLLGRNYLSNSKMIGINAD